MKVIVREIMCKKKQKKKTLFNSEEIVSKNLFMVRCKEWAFKSFVSSFEIKIFLDK